jgi:hypothetical protein
LSFLLEFELALLPWNRSSVPCPYQESAAKEGSLGHQPSDPRGHYARRGEIAKNTISVLAVLGEGLPLVEGDRVQLQQVMLKLINNAVQAMSGIGVESRELVICAGRTKEWANQLMLGTSVEATGTFSMRQQLRSGEHSSVRQYEVSP